MFFLPCFPTGNRVSDIAYWKSELVNEMREMDMETENLEVILNIEKLS